MPQGTHLFFVDRTGESAAAGVITAIGADTAVPDPSDAAWPKWVAWGAILVGAVIYDMCTDDQESQCDYQYYKVDIPKCRAIAKSRGKAAAAECYKSAADRYAACLAGRVLPPLNTWNN